MLYISGVPVTDCNVIICLMLNWLSWKNESIFQKQNSKNVSVLSWYVLFFWCSKRQIWSTIFLNVKQGQKYWNILGITISHSWYSSADLSKYNWWWIGLDNPIISNHQWQNSNRFSASLYIVFFAFMYWNVVCCLFFLYVTVHCINERTNSSLNEIWTYNNLEEIGNSSISLLWRIFCQMLHSGQQNMG